MPNAPQKDVSENTSLSTFLACFSTLSDPRRTNKGHFLYPLEEILFLTISACVSGASSWTGIQSFGEEKLDWLRKFFLFQYGIASHDAISDFFILLCPTAFGTCFMDWVNSIHHLSDGRLVAIDGKTVRGAAGKGGKKSSLHIVSAYASMQRICLGQTDVEEKSNEITAIPKLLDLLMLQGSILTIDAMGCQKDIAEKIVSKQADYILMVKDNQPGLKGQIVKVFDRREGLESSESIDFGHGRIETRRCDLTSCLAFLDGKEEWKNLRSIVRISAQRYNKKTGASCSEQRFYITSLPNDPELLNASIRSHWAIENNLHWNLDVIFKEDGQLKRQGNSAQNFNMVSKMALAMIDARSRPRTLNQTKGLEPLAQIDSAKLS